MHKKMILCALGGLAGGLALGILCGHWLWPAHDHDGCEEEGHAHGSGQAITVWGDRFEVFIEHPPIVAETPAEFVTHVSDLVTFEPRREGPVTFVAKRGAEAPVTHVEPTPASNGIYLPDLIFPRAGTWAAGCETDRLTCSET